MYAVSGAMLMREHEFVHEVCAELLPEMPTALAHALFVALDRSCSGTLDEEEFVCGFAVLAHGDAEARLRLVFDVCDLDRDGRLSAMELKRCARSEPPSRGWGR